MAGDWIGFEREADCFKIRAGSCSVRVHVESGAWGGACGGGGVGCRLEVAEMRQGQMPHAAEDHA